MNLETIIATDPTISKWFSYEAEGIKGLELEISYIDPDQLSELEREHGGKDQRERYVSAFIRRTLKNWRGLTFRNLRVLAATSEKQEDGHEFVFTLNGAAKLVQKSYGLWGFIFSRATNIRYFQSEDELKNSGTGPGGT